MEQTTEAKQFTRYCEMFGFKKTSRDDYTPHESV